MIARALFAAHVRSGDGPAGRAARLSLALVLLASVVTVSTVARADQPDAVHIGSIAPGGAAFYDDGYVGHGVLHALPVGLFAPPADRCGLEHDLEGACFVYTLDVQGSGALLRIAYDTPMRDDNFELYVTSPGGTTTRATNGNQYSVEVLFPAPAPGTWRITLVPYSAEDAPFRIRAKLEAAPSVPQPDADGYLLPNLRVLRMWEFGFAAPANPFNGLFPPDDINPPLQAGGFAPLSCTADEMAGPAVGDPAEPSEQCLRYSFGLGNAGPGTFDVRWAGERTATGQVEMVQCVQRVAGDGSRSVEASAAGTGSFHTTHGHWHYDDVIHHQLYAVTDSGLQAIGDGKKIGYSPADQAITDWRAFTNAPAGTSGAAGNCAPGSNQRLGMSAGWGDAYRYQRPGNYVEFSMAPGDGQYVVQTIADPLDQIRETNEDDNVFYAHLQVTGDRIDVLETGLGQSPWDPNKTIVADWWA